MSEEEDNLQWIEASLFEPILQDIFPNFEQIVDFNIVDTLVAGENHNTFVLQLEIVVKIDEDNYKPVSLILKTSKDAEMSRILMRIFNIFEIETTMYTEIIPEFERLYEEVGHEITFGAKFYKINTANPCIILEDLCVRGFKHVNRLEGLDMEHTEAVLNKLAQWHAASALYVNDKGEYEERINAGAFTEEVRSMLVSMFRNIWPVFFQVARTYEEDEDYFEALCDTQWNLIQLMMEGSEVDPNEFNVLNHGDCWCNNVMFQYDASGEIKETYFLDFQTPKYGSPAQDLYYFILSSTKFEIKTTEFDYFIKYYHRQLVAHLKLLNYAKKIPTLKDIHMMLSKYGIWGYISANTIMAGALMHSIQLPDIEEFANYEELDTLFKTQLYSNRRYREHLKLVLPWLYNRGAFSRDLYYNVI